MDRTRKTVPITVAWKAVDTVTARITTAARDLSGDPSTADRIRAAQSLHWAGVRLADLEVWVGQNLRTTSEPEVLLLHERIRLITDLLAAVRREHADALRRGDLELRAGEPGYDPHLQKRQRRWWAASGAVGPGRR